MIGYFSEFQGKEPMVSLKKIGPPAICAMLVVFLVAWVAPPAQAVDTAPRISDREIIESLAELKEGHKGLWKGLEALNKRMDRLDQRMDRLDQRMDGLDQRMDGLRTEIKQDIQNLRVEINSRFSTLYQLIIAMLTMIGGLIGFIVWDRRSTVQPVINQLEGVKQELEGVKLGLVRDLDLQHQGGPLLTRVVKALREYAQTNGEFATILRSASLL